MLLHCGLEIYNIQSIQMKHMDVEYTFWLAVFMQEQQRHRYHGCTLHTQRKFSQQGCIMSAPTQDEMDTSTPVCPTVLLRVSTLDLEPSRLDLILEPTVNSWIGALRAWRYISVPLLRRQAGDTPANVK